MSPAIKRTDGKINNANESLLTPVSINTGINPFKKSIRKIKIPAFPDPVTSNEFIAPTLPVPSSLMSLLYLLFTKIYAVGIDPVM